MQDGVEVALGTGEQRVPPGPVTAELCVVDPDTQALVAIDEREATAVEGETVEVAFQRAPPTDSSG